MMTEKTFGERMREVRQAKGLTLYDLAVRLAVNESSVSYMETRGKKPRYATIMRVAQALGVDVSVLTGETIVHEWTFGRRVRAHRLARGWSQWDMALKLGTVQSHVTTIETGRNTPNMKTVQKLAAVFGITMDELCNGDMTGYVSYEKPSVVARGSCKYCGYAGDLGNGICPHCNARLEV